MIRRQYTLSAIGLAALLAVSGCGRSKDLTPPRIEYGATECAHCRMIVSEQRFAAALVLPTDHEVVKLAFDDVGCLLDYLAANQPSGTYAPYVQDVENLGWLDAREAVFVHSTELRTPMASNLAALSSEAAATRFQQQYPGRQTRFTKLCGASAPGQISPPAESEDVP